MIQMLRPALVLFIALTILTGGVYPCFVTVVAQGLFPWQANGCLLKHQETVTGSLLIGQSFSKPEFFWGRLSATSPAPHNAAASSGSNRGPLHPDRVTAAKARIEALTATANAAARVPIDLVTASASGLDPHISPAAAEYQIPRVAQARHQSADDLRHLVQRCTEERWLGIVGERRVNVQRLNLLLDGHDVQSAQ